MMSSENENAFNDFSIRFHVVAFMLRLFRASFHLVLVESVVDKTGMAAK